MNNFGQYMTPTEYLEDWKKHHGNKPAPFTLEELERRANEPEMDCCICGVEKVWRHAGTDMCFSCTTGEADASDDIELLGSPSQIREVLK